MGLFYLLTLYCAIRAVDAPPSRWIAGSIAACALGMGSKEAMVTGAGDGVAVGSDVSRRRTARPCAQPRRAVLRPRGDVVAPRVLVITQPRTHSRLRVRRVAVVAVPDHAGRRRHALPAARVRARAARARLRVAGVIARGCVAAGAAARRAPRDLRPACGSGIRSGFAGAWFFVILAPTSSVVPIVTEVAAEHRMYLPLAAVIVVAVLGVDALLRRVRRDWPARPASRSRLRPRSHAPPRQTRAIAISSATKTIWRDTVEKRPDNARARNNYAVDLIARGAMADAVPALRSRCVWIRRSRTRARISALRCAA